MRVPVDSSLSARRAFGPGIARAEPGLVVTGEFQLELVPGEPAKPVLRPPQHCRSRLGDVLVLDPIEQEAPGLGEQRLAQAIAQRILGALLIASRLLECAAPARRVHVRFSPGDALADLVAAPRECLEALERAADLEPVAAPRRLAQCRLVTEPLLGDT